MFILHDDLYAVEYREDEVPHLVECLLLVLLVFLLLAHVEDDDDEANDDQADQAGNDDLHE